MSNNTLTSVERGNQFECEVYNLLRDMGLRVNHTR